MFVYFCKSTNKYKRNKPHYDARCKQCMSAKIEMLGVADAKAVSESTKEAVRAKDALLQRL
jgi:hypothetical protein